MSRLLVQVSHVSLSLSSKPLFEDISLSIHEGSLFALIGENGAGKTSLLQLLAGIYQPDSGTYHTDAGVSIGFLPQEISLLNPKIGVRAFLEEGTLLELERRMARCLEDTDNLLEWSRLHEQYEQLGGYRAIPTEKVLSGLKIGSDLLDKEMGALSSGQRVRVQLAKILSQNPYLLLLDEPTNHLDQEMVRWLQSFLKEKSCTCVIVSHDRKFLNSVCNKLFEVKDGALTLYGGNYDFYLAEQEGRLAREIKAYEAKEEEIALLKQQIKALTFAKSAVRPPKDRNIMCYDRTGERNQKSQRHKLDTLKARLEVLENGSRAHPRPKSIKGLHFDSPACAAAFAIELDDVSKTYGNNVLFSHLSKQVLRNDRILIEGVNGCGKTTLLRAIAGQISLDKGCIRYATDIKIAYLDQEIDQLSLNETPLEYFQGMYHISEEELRSELHKSALGGGELLRRPFSTLSTGQRKRMMLLSCLLKKPNVWLLDEPTNHLDFLTLEAFEKALLEFKGAVIVVSHDATFIGKIAVQKWTL